MALITILRGEWMRPVDNLIELVVAAVRGVVPDSAAWVAVLARRSMEYLLGPVRDQGGRFHWLALLAALALTALVYVLGPRPSATDPHADPAGAAPDAVPRSRGRLAGFLRYCFPARFWLTRSTWVDIQVGFVNSVYAYAGLNLTWRITSALLASWVTAALTAGFGPVAVPAQWGPVSILLFAIAISMASDFGYFLFHWASHSFPPLWAIHKLHHSAEVMTPLTAARVHPLERVVMGPIRAVTVGLVVGPAVYLYAGETPPLTVFGLEAMAVVFNLLGHVLHHSHVWLYFGPVVGRVIVSPAQHQIHHSSLPQHLDRNFGEHWALWDWMFGTLYLPKGREPVKFGLAGYTRQPHNGLVSAYLRPVADSAIAGWALARRWAAAARLAAATRPPAAQPPQPPAAPRR